MYDLNSLKNHNLYSIDNIDSLLKIDESHRLSLKLI